MRDTSVLTSNPAAPRLRLELDIISQRTVATFNEVRQLNIAALNAVLVASLVAMCLVFPRWRRQSAETTAGLCRSLADAMHIQP